MFPTFTNIDMGQWWIINFITFIVLYSIIKPYNSFFVINRHIARQNFILNNLFSGGWNPDKILNLLAKRFLRPLQWRHTNTNRKWHRSFTNASRMQIYICTHWISTRIYDIKWISSWVFGFENKQTIPTNRSRYTKKNLVC